MRNSVLICVVGLFSLAAARMAGAGPRPNVVLILADDMGWGDMHSHGNDQIDTPRLDRLAEEGIEFERFYVSPVCSPTRASLLTGRHFLRTGVRGTSQNYETMRADEVTIAEALKAGGYATGCFGKWHNGFYYPNNAIGQGFDEFLGFNGGYFHDYFDPVLTRDNGERVQSHGYINDVIAGAAADFIRRHRDEPFFCYVPFNTPHSPLQVNDALFEKYKQRGLSDYNAAIYGMVESIDTNVGRLLGTLEELRLTDRTIVIFFSDNGPNAGGTNDRYTAGLRGRKGSVHEGGVRSPFFIQYPDRFKGGRKLRQIAAHVDLFDTLIELTGVPIPKTLPRDGRSLVPLLEGRTDEWTDRLLPEALGGGRGAVRNQQFRLVVRGQKPGLYDIEQDPGETKDLTATHPTVADELRNAFFRWFDEATQSGPNTGKERVPIPIGHPEAPFVEVPGQYCFREGEKGLRFPRAGWDWEWVTNWTNTKQYIWWDIDVVRPGRYEIAIRYTCPPSDVGSRMLFCIGDVKQKFVIDKAAEIKEITFPDRYPRWEVNDREWLTQRIDQFELKQGRMRLELRALQIAGNATMDLHTIEVRRIE